MVDHGGLVLMSNLMLKQMAKFAGLMMFKWWLMMVNLVVHWMVNLMVGGWFIDGFLMMVSLMLK